MTGAGVYLPNILIRERQIKYLLGGYQGLEKGRGDRVRLVLS